MTVISMFSGAGGLDLGLIRAGHQVVWANDIDADCVETYRRNIGEHIELGDVSAVDTPEVPDADALVGGWPCQGFSLANLRRHVGDERNRLYQEFRRFLAAKRPRYFLAENVKGILSLGGGQVVGRIVSDLQALGYRVEYRLCNVADYGVPQTRERVIFAGTRSDLAQKYRFSFPEPTHSEQGSAGLKRWVSIRDALRDIPEPCPDSKLPNHVGSKYKLNGRNFTGHRFVDPDKPSPTLLARGNGKGGVCAGAHWSNARRMTVRESATIQTFPLDFEFIGSLGSCYRQVGNAVPVLFAEHLGKALARCEELCAL
ncbi:MAG: DNA cytosine methyltransferase [Armatimonadota bacterium]